MCAQGKKPEWTNNIKQLLLEKTGILPRNESSEKLLQAIDRRIAGHRLIHPSHYYQLLQNDEEFSRNELEYFTKLLTTGETYFFRDQGQMSLIRDCLLPTLIKRRSQKRSLRIWSAGCASGEEPYSLAMLLDELLPSQREWELFIYGTDINPDAIDKAQRGLYSSWSFRWVDSAVKRKYFHQHKDGWQLDERIQDMVTFKVSNLLADDFPHNNSQLHDMDLILCRNVFIYFTPDHAALIADKLAATLRESGYLLTGHNELHGHRMEKLQSQLFSEGLVYQRSAPDTAITACTPPFATTVTPPAERSTKSAPPPPPGHHDSQAPPLPSPNVETYLIKAQDLADRGDYDDAEAICRQALSIDPLSVRTNFLCAQLAQLKGEFERTVEFLDKTLYLDPGHIAALMERAALHMRAGDLERARFLRRSALANIRKYPDDALVEPYEITAAEITQMLMQEAGAQE